MDTQKPKPIPMGAAVTCDTYGRESARGVLEHEARRHENKAIGLRALLDALPAKLPTEADAALWDLVTSRRW